MTQITHGNMEITVFMETVCTEWHCWLKKVEGGESCKFLTEDIMAAKNLHSAPQFP